MKGVGEGEKKRGKKSTFNPWDHEEVAKGGLFSNRKRNLSDERQRVPLKETRCPNFLNTRNNGGRAKGKNKKQGGERPPIAKKTHIKRKK